MQPFEGVYPAIPTPFDENGDIDYDRVREHVTRLEEAGVDGIVPAGSTGESATLTHEEHLELTEVVLDAVDVPVVPGTGTNSTEETLELSRDAAEIGADGLLLVSPYYNIPERSGMEAHYRAVADAVELPQILYNVPGRTGVDIHMEAAVALAEHDNVVGYKAASTDLERISELTERTRDESFAVLSGDDPVTLPILSVGGRGCISVAANLVPERVCEMVAAASEGNYEQARRLHHELGPLYRAMFAETNPIPIKELLALRENREPRFRKPMTPAAPELRARLEEILDSLE
jgi:4-hydroxy-tetrahydrodipicolinate synthase